MFGKILSGVRKGLLEKEVVKCELNCKVRALDEVGFGFTFWHRSFTFKF
jgi:hypothetical protein